MAQPSREDDSDFGEFYAARKDAVLRAVLVSTGDRARAEDATAEAFARAYARWDQVRRHQNPTAWVMRVALNAHRSWWRRLRRELLGSLPERVAPAPPPPVGLDSQLRVLVENLPERQRAVVALRLLADLSAEETAQLLGIAPATVHVHLHRALATLRAQLTANGNGKAEEVLA